MKRKIVAILGVLAVTAMTAFGQFTNAGKTVMVNSTNFHFLDPNIIPSNSILTNGQANVDFGAGLTVMGIPVVTGAVSSGYAAVAGVASNALKLGGIDASAYLTNAVPTNWASYPALANVNLNGGTISNGSGRLNNLDVLGQLGGGGATLQVAAQGISGPAAAPLTLTYGAQGAAGAPVALYNGATLATGNFNLNGGTISNGTFRGNGAGLTNLSVFSTNWSSYPALTTVNLGGQLVTNGQLFLTSLNQPYDIIYAKVNHSTYFAGRFEQDDVGGTAVYARNTAGGDALRLTGRLSQDGYIIATNGFLFSGGNPVLTNASPTNWSAYPALQDIVIAGNYKVRLNTANGSDNGNIWITAYGNTGGGAALYLDGRDAIGGGSATFYVGALTRPNAAFTVITANPTNQFKLTWPSGHNYTVDSQGHDFGGSSVSNVATMFINGNLWATGRTYTCYINTTNYVYELTPDVGQKWIISVSNNVVVTNILPLR